MDVNLYVSLRIQFRQEEEVQRNEGVENRSEVRGSSSRRA